MAGRSLTDTHISEKIHHNRVYIYIRHSRFTRVDFWPAIKTLGEIKLFIQTQVAKSLEFLNEYVAL